MNTFAGTTGKTIPISMSAPTIIVNVIKGSVKAYTLLSGKRWKLPGEVLTYEGTICDARFQNAEEPPNASTIPGNR